MAIAVVGSFGTGASGVSGTTLVMTTTAALEAGNYGLIGISFDNTATTDGFFNEITSVVDSAGNTYTRVPADGEFINGQTAAAAGAGAGLWMTKATSTLVLGGTVTITFSNTIVDKCCWGHEFTVGAGNTLALSTAVVGNATDGANGFGSLAFTGLPSLSRLWIRPLAKEANSTVNISVSTGFTATGFTRSRNNASAVIVRGEFRINASTGETSNPTLAVLGDTASVFAALEEVAPPAGNRRRRVLMGVS